MKKTPLYEEHKKLGAKLVDFAGWEMPVFYTNVIEEHIATRTAAGLFDISHMGEIEIKGKEAFNIIQNIITNDLNKLSENKAFYSVMCNEKGTVIDDIFIYCINREHYMLVVNAGTKDKDLAWIKQHSTDVGITDKTDRIAKIDLQGPRSEEILQKLTTTNLKELKRFHFIESKIQDTETIISRTGYTAEDGFELYLQAESAAKIWNIILETGKPFNIRPVGLGARDTLRLEACYSLYGHELSEDINPIEAGVKFVVKLDKENFIGKQALETITPKRKIAAFELLERGIPRQNYEIFKDNTKIGYVTSGTMSPTLKKGIGLGFIDIEHINLGTEIHIKIREKLYKAQIVEKPFYTYKR